MKTINTERLVLRNFSEQDGNDFYEYFSNPKVLAFEPFKPFSKEEAFAEAKRRVTDERFVAVCLHSGKLIGNLYIAKEDFDTWEVGYVFNEAYWGEGYASESLKAMLYETFTNLGARRVVALCDPKNEPSWKLLERMGMRREGHFLQNVYFFEDENGEPLWKDTFQYAISKKRV